MKDKLTKRQIDVLNYIVTGISNQEIATILNISKRTVESHARSIYVVYNVKSRTELTALINKTENKSCQIILEEVLKNIINYTLDSSILNDKHLAKIIYTAKQFVTKDFINKLNKNQKSKLEYMVWYNEQL